MTKAIDLYKKSAKGKDFHLMSGNHSIEKTRFVSKEIIKTINPKPEDHIIDVGCGDGTLLEMINKTKTPPPHASGVATTDQERDRLRQEYPDLNFITGLAESLPYESDSANKLVCNSVLLLLDLDTIKKSLDEFHRVLQKDGLAYIGEIPEVQEFEFVNSIMSRALSRLRKDGILSLAKMALLASKEKMTEGKFVRLDTHYYSKPEEFINLAKEHGLQYTFHFKHKTLNHKSELVQTDRWNYVFSNVK